MGQATTDLPDPAEKAALDGAPSADDLLAKVANDEIDRLLAEADAGLVSPADASAASPAVVVANAECVPAAEGAGVVDAGAAVPATEPRKTTAAADVNVSDQLDALFSELNRTIEAAPEKADLPSNAEIDRALPSIDVAAEKGGEARGPGEVCDGGPAAPLSDSRSSPEGALSGTAGVGVGVGVERSGVIDVADQTGSVERQALAGPVVEAVRADVRSEEVGGAVADSPGGVDGSQEDPALLRLLIRVLEWINAPIAQYGDEVRGLIGKIAVLTLINALAVLVFVLVFRH